MVHIKSLLNRLRFIIIALIQEGLKEIRKEKAEALERKSAVG